MARGMWGASTYARYDTPRNRILLGENFMGSSTENLLSANKKKVQGAPKQESFLKRWQTKISTNDNWAGYLFLLPWLIGFFAFTFLPILASLILAVTQKNILSQ